MSDANKDQSRQDLERRLQELRETKDQSTPEFRQKQRDVSRDLNASIDRGDLDTSTPRNGAVFYDNGGSRQRDRGLGAATRPQGFSNSLRAKIGPSWPVLSLCRGNAGQLGAVSCGH